MSFNGFENALQEAKTKKASKNVSTVLPDALKKQMTWAVQHSYGLVNEILEKIKAINEAKPAEIAKATELLRERVISVTLVQPNTSAEGDELIDFISKELMLRLYDLLESAVVEVWCDKDSEYPLDKAGAMVKAYATYFQDTIFHDKVKWNGKEVENIFHAGKYIPRDHNATPFEQLKTWGTFARQHQPRATKEHQMPSNDRITQTDVGVSKELKLAIKKILETFAISVMTFNRKMELSETQKKVLQTVHVESVMERSAFKKIIFFLHALEIAAKEHKVKVNDAQYANVVELLEKLRKELNISDADWENIPFDLTEAAEECLIDNLIKKEASETPRGPSAKDLKRLRREFNS